MFLSKVLFKLTFKSEQFYSILKLPNFHLSEKPSNDLVQTYVTSFVDKILTLIKS